MRTSGERCQIDLGVSRSVVASKRNDDSSIDQTPDTHTHRERERERERERQDGRMPSIVANGLVMCGRGGRASCYRRQIVRILMSGRFATVSLIAVNKTRMRPSAPPRKHTGKKLEDE